MYGSGAAGSSSPGPQWNKQCWGSDGQKKVPESFLRLMWNRSLSKASPTDSSIEKIMMPKLNLNHEIYLNESDSVYGLTFSEDGRSLFTGSSDGSIKLVDNRTHRVVKDKHDAHDNCCNGCTVIDHYRFASYSDDQTVKVWDIRNWNDPTTTLTGHDGWVKNVFVVPGTNYLLTSDMEEAVHKFDISIPDSRIESSPLFRFRRLCRINLSPSGETLFLTTSRTNIYKIQNFDIESIQKDMLDFESNPKQSKPFGQTRNIIEFVHFVPRNLEEFCATYSIDVSNDEQSCVMRHCTREHNAEWIAVYDLQKKNKARESRSGYSSQEEDDDESDPEFEEIIDNDLFAEYNWDGLRDGRISAEEWESYRFRRQQQEQTWARKLSIKVDRYLTEKSNLIRLRMNMIFGSWIEDINDDTFHTRPVSPQEIRDAEFFFPFDHSASGIIKETTFSRSGNLIASPSPAGFKILSFDKDVNSFGTALAKQRRGEEDVMPPKLTLIKECVVRRDAYCLCVKFSPVENVIVAGDEKGRVFWFSSL